MNDTTLKTVCFSPTGTTGKVVRAIARGMGYDKAELIDITSPAAREQSLETTEEDLLIVGVPVYMGRVPAVAGEWLMKMEARKTPVVCVVVYGNRAYDNALLELTDIVKERGGIPVAGAAYIGEHSFSISEFPIAEGCPRENDLAHAEEFGRRVRDKLRNQSPGQTAPELRIPGERPYGSSTELWSVDFIEVGSSCLNLGKCADVCPVGAIDPGNPRLIDRDKCITCCACIKVCPQQARSIKPGKVKEAAQRLNGLFAEPKSPETFL